jgi:hypothetical protein
MQRLYGFNHPHNFVYPKRFTIRSRSGEMKSKTFLLILALILLAVPACTAKPPSLYNSAWVLTELNGKPVETFLRDPFF